METDERDNHEREALRAEATEIARTIRQQSILLVGAALFMVVTLAVPPALLLFGNAETTVPVFNIRTTVWGVVLFGPLVLAGLLFYTHILLGRLEAITARGIHPPEVHFFTMRSLTGRLFADVYFYMVFPCFMLWFYVSAHFLPQSRFLLVLTCFAFVACAWLHGRRMRRRDDRDRRRLGIVIRVVAVAVALPGLVASALWQQGGREVARSVARRVVGLDLRGQELASIAGPGNLRTLRGYDFSGACLAGADFSGLILTGADFRGADLYGAVLDGATLDDADFTGADLSRASARGALFHGATLDRAVLLHADLRQTNFEDAVLDGAWLNQAALGGASFRNATARGASFDRARHVPRREEPSAAPTPVLFPGADLTCVAAREAEFSGARFSRTRLPRADFGMANLADAAFVNADLRASDLRRANLAGATLVNVDAAEALFSETAASQLTRRGGAPPAFGPLPSCRPPPRDAVPPALGTRPCD